MTERGEFAEQEGARNPVGQAPPVSARPLSRTVGHDVPRTGRSLLSMRAPSSRRPKEDRDRPRSRLLQARAIWPEFLLPPLPSGPSVRKLQHGHRPVRRRSAIAASCRGQPRTRESNREGSHGDQARTRRPAAAGHVSRGGPRGGYVAVTAADVRTRQPAVTARAAVTALTCTVTHTRPQAPAAARRTPWG